MWHIATPLLVVWDGLPSHRNRLVRDFVADTASTHVIVGLRTRHRPLDQVARPVLHQDTPTLKEVRARVGRLDLVPDHVRQGRLDHVPGMIRLLGRLVPERRAEAVRHGRDLVPLEQAAQLMFEKRLPVPGPVSRARPIRDQFAGAGRRAPGRFGSVARDHQLVPILRWAFV